LKKTVAVSESTWEKLKMMMKRKGAKDFDELIRMLLQESEELPPSMFGVDTGLKLQYSQKEHEEFVNDTH
jgi:predicted CopG family antitoxin